MHGDEGNLSDGWLMVIENAGAERCGLAMVLMDSRSYADNAFSKSCHSTVRDPQTPAARRSPAPARRDLPRA